MTIKELRKQQNLSQVAFAAKLGISAVTVSAIETGRMNLSPKLAVKVKEAFGMEVESSAITKQQEKKEEKIVLKLSGKAAADAKPKKRTEKYVFHPASEALEKEISKTAPVSVPVIYIQSPYGGEITPEEVVAKIPEDTDSCFVRVDQNLIWWVRMDGETGAVKIWE